MSRCLYLRILQIFQVRNHLEEFEYFLNIKMLLRMNGDTSRWNCFEYNFYDREYKSFVQCVFFLLQYYILFSHSSANDDIISLFLYYMEFVKLQQDGLSLKRFVCLIRHQICNPFCNTRVLWFQWFCKVIIGYGDVIAYKIPINN